MNSMSDLFHEGVSDDYIVEVANVMCRADWHTYQVLTKRAKPMKSLLGWKLAFAAEQAHMWWGVSVENKRAGLPRVEHLRAAKAKAIPMIEPLLRGSGRYRPRWHSLGHCGRGKWTGRPTNTQGVGNSD